MVEEKSTMLWYRIWIKRERWLWLHIKAEDIGKEGRYAAERELLDIGLFANGAVIHFCLQAMYETHKTTLITDDVEVEFCTGISDKHQKKMYHKDRIRHDDGAIGIVERDEKIGCWFFDWDDGQKNSPRREGWNDFEIIGTVHDDVRDEPK